MHRPTLGSKAAFRLIIVTTVAVMFGAAAPSPLYPVYQELWGFSSFTLTVIFAVYVIALLAGLLTVGSLSDHVGRRPVILGALAVLTGSMLMFAFADGVPMLIAARVLQGLAAGAITGTLSAALVDLQPTPRAGSIASSASPPGGLALGAVGAGILVQYAPMPRELVFLLLVATFVLVAAVVVFVPETSPRTGFASRRHLWRVLRPNASLPPAVRGAFLAATPAMFATWSLGGLYLSLGSSIVARILGLENHMVAGLMIGAFFGSGALGSAVASGWGAHRKLAVGLSTLGTGLIVSLVATLTANVPAYAIGSVVAGFGFGATFVGVMATLIAVTDPAARGQVFSTLFIVSYTGFSIPAVVAGFAVIHIGLRPTAVAYGLFVLAMVILAAGAAIWRARAERRTSPPVTPAIDAELVTAAADTSDTSR